jgi:hypothetical protein
MISPTFIIPSVTYTDPIPFETAATLRERVWATVSGVADDAQLIARTEDSSVVATASAVGGQARLTASMPITADRNKAHLFVQLLSATRSAGARAFRRSLYRRRAVIELHEWVSRMAPVGNSRFRLRFRGGVIEGLVIGHLIRWKSLKAFPEADEPSIRQTELRLGAESFAQVPTLETAETTAAGSSKFSTAAGQAVLEAHDGGWLASLVYDGDIAVELQARAGRIVIWDEIPTEVDLKAGFCVHLPKAP